MSKLPNKPSDLLDVALRDLEACEQDDNYEIRMSLWHSSNHNLDKKCFVCLAGAVMAKTMGTPVTARGDPYDLVPHAKNKLQFIDACRPYYYWDEGFTVRETVEDLGKMLNHYLRTMVGSSLEPRVLEKIADKIHSKGGAIDYSENPDEFKDYMRWLSDLLREEGM